MATGRKLLWWGDRPAPSNVLRAAEGRWDLQPSRADQPLAGQLSAAGVALTCPNGQADDPQQLRKLLDTVERSSAVTIILLPPEAEMAWGLLAGRAGKFVCIRQDASPEEIIAKVSAAQSLQPAIRDLETELAEARKLVAVGSQLEELDEEMRLAARLQRDFLPRRLPEMDPVRFGVLYRPLGWVSGDIYDVARLDETHVGFYVADAVGHGMPAALLTMFIKQALQTKRIVGNSYEIFPPHLSLGQLNTAICEQNLSSCQFCTAVYCVLDVSDLTLTYARAGHPEPILIHRDGSLADLAVPGSLLGVFPEEQYDSATVSLAPGDRLVLYSDGVEDALVGRSGDPNGFRNLLTSCKSASREEMLLQITAAIDESAESPGPKDDVTVVTLDVLP